MADKQMMCPHCAEVKPHLTITEGRIHICNTCGWETKFKPGETGPAPRETKAAPYALKVTPTETIARKYETEGKTMHKLTLEDIANIKRRRAAGEKPKELAKEFGVHRCIIYALPKGLNPRKATEPRKDRQPAKVEAGGGFRHQVERMVAEAVDKRLAGLGLDNLDAKIEAALARLLK